MAQTLHSIEISSEPGLAPIGTKPDSLLTAFVLSLYACTAILVVFLAITSQIYHWFAIPLLACGALIGIDGVRALRGQTDIFKPIGFIGILGMHFFFLAPLLHVRWDYWLQYIDTYNVDWRYWLGRMALINTVGILLYISARELVLNLRSPETQSTLWTLNIDRFKTITTIALVLTGILQIVVYAQFGGLVGYMQATEASSEESMAGFGIVFMFSESFPIVAMMAFVVWAGAKVDRQSWKFLIAALIAFLVLRILFGGLRGSRGNIVWALFWGVGMIHFWLRPIPRRLLYAGVVLVLLIMYLYGFYKTFGSQTFLAFQQQGSFAALEQQTGRTAEGLFLGDFARADVQAFLLHRLSPTIEGVDYSFANGETYLGALSLVVPSWIWDSGFADKVSSGTNALYGEGSSHLRRSSRAYGLAGETMLNFGPLFIPVAYAFLGVAVATIQRWMGGLQYRDSRLLIAPLATIFAFYLLIWDSDNLVVLFFKLGFVPILILLLSSRKQIHEVTP